MAEANRKEINGLLEKRDFRVMLREDIPQQGNLLSGRFVLPIKSIVNWTIKCKSRYVIGVQRDRIYLLAHTSTILQPHCVRLQIAPADLFDFKVWKASVRQAYLQSLEHFSRDIYIEELVSDFELETHHCVELLKPLNGYSNAGEMLLATMNKRPRKEIGLFYAMCSPQRPQCALCW